MYLRLRKLGAWLALAGLTGCGGRLVIPRSDLDDPPHSASYFVTTTAGEEMEFVTFRTSPDSLEGTVRTVRQRVSAEGDTERMQTRNEYHEVALPMSQVSRVEIERHGPDRRWLLAGGAVLLGAAILVTTSGNNGNNGNDGGGGKEPPPLDN